MNDVRIDSPPPERSGSTIDRYNGIIDVALDNRGEWVSMEIEEISTNHYAVIYRHIAKALGASVKHIGDQLYVYVPNVEETTDGNKTTFTRTTTPSD